MADCYHPEVARSGQDRKWHCCLCDEEFVEGSKLDALTRDAAIQMRQREGLFSTNNLLLEQVADLESRLQAASNETENWKQTAAQFLDGQKFYQGIVRQVGNLYGMAARTSDDGSVQDDVLALKVPELVAHYMAQAAEVAATAKRCDERANALSLRLHAYRERTIVQGAFGAKCNVCRGEWAYTRGDELHEDWCPNGSVVEKL